MTKVFVGGSRRVSRLDHEVKRRIDQIMEQGLPVLVGDANGADRAIQEYLRSRGHAAVEVFCSGGQCRNNVGNWPVRAVFTRESPGTFDYYAAKDEQMAQEATVGLMIWDGKSPGTLANAARLLRQDKKVEVYATPVKRFLSLEGEGDLQRLLSACASDVRRKVLRSVSGALRSPVHKQSSLF